MSTAAGGTAAGSTTVAQAVAQAVARQGCTHVFGLMGDGNMHLIQALADADVRIVEVRHEGAAVAMAEGYSWSSGGVGFCTVTHGPGLTHTATSLVAAARNRSPVVVIAAETPWGYAGAQCFDQQAFAAACEVPYRQLSPHEDATAVLDEAAAYARAEERPVMLGVAADVLAQRSASASVEQDRQLILSPSPSADDDLAAARETRAALEQARRPVLLVGRGGASADSVRAVMTLADRFGAALATTLKAKGVFDAHPGNLGVSGGLSHPAAQLVLRQSDVVIAVGASLDRGTTQSMRLFPDAEIVQVTNEPGAGRTPPSVRRLRADADGMLRHLLGLTSGAPDRAPWFTPVPPPAVAWAADLADYAPPVGEGMVDPRPALMTINAAIPDKAIIVISNGHCSGFTATLVDRPTAGRFFTAQGFGSIGQAFPSAVGAALGAPGRKVAVFEGDAAFMMHAQEVETAARAGADVTLFVLNDQALGTEFQRLATEGAGAELAVVPTPDLSVVAAALGARAEAVSRIDDVPEVAERALRPGLAVVEVRTDRSVVSRHMRAH